MTLFLAWSLPTYIEEGTQPKNVTPKKGRALTTNSEASVIATHNQTNKPLVLINEDNIKLVLNT